MTQKSSAVLIGAVLIALLIGGGIGYLARTAEVSALMSSNAMMRNEVQSMSGSVISLMPASGPMPPHDVWLIITPMQGGRYAVVLHATGLEANGSYLVEGVTRGSMNTVPIANNTSDSEFLPDSHGNGVYWHVFDSDLRAQFEMVQLVYLPNMQMQGAMQVASADLSQ
jgi:hypothetical protein